MNINSATQSLSRSIIDISQLEKLPINTTSVTGKIDINNNAEKNFPAVDNIIQEIVQKEALLTVNRINTTVPGWEADTIAIYTQDITKPNAIIFDFLKVADKVVGYIVVRFSKLIPSEAEGAAYMHYIAIEAAAQRQGNGEYLLEKTIEKLKNMSFTKLDFECEAHNVKFYQDFASKHQIKADILATEETYENGERLYTFTYTFAENSYDSTIPKVKMDMCIAKFKSKFPYIYKTPEKPSSEMNVVNDPENTYPNPEKSEI